MPLISVIIPTHNRCASLQRTLDALKKQTCPLEQVEVIVVADGCSDATVTTLQNSKAPFLLKVIEQPGQGAAAARNQGAIQASADLLLFLDDDIEAAPQLLEAHLEAHRQHSNRVVLGYLPPILQVQTALFRPKLRSWWEATFQPMRQPGHRYSYRNLLTGNVSLSADLFEQVGRFDCDFKCHEDYELGVRLIQAGATFSFSEDAVGYHHEMTDLDRSLQRKYQEGKASVQFGRKYPELMPTFPIVTVFASPPSWFYQVLPGLVFQFPQLFDFVAARLRSCLNLLEWGRCYGFWQMLLYRLLGYWYLRGMVDELRDRASIARFLESATPRVPEEFELELDLQKGLRVAEQLLDHCRPASVKIRYGQQFLVQVPAIPGSERLRGTHLRSILATTSGYSFFLALLLEGVAKLDTTSELQA